MSTITNKIKVASFVSYPLIQVEPLSSSVIQWELERSVEIKLTAQKPAKTPSFRKPSSVTVLLIPRGSVIGGWHMKSALLVQVRHSRRESVATTWLEGVAEYGTGAKDDEAISDLVVSLGEYCKSLEKREKKLGDSARKELNHLRRLVERSAASSRTR